ncbi:cytochrome c biogenesis CcdA family protein [Ruania rhizosphaerae]|uniref:cytochrome c biogenesis CcdA family protein n=1 Tax=Ruania rhizosphaerae TaxID=1840413 RepID=UPI001359B33D|nr:cytochrome c biogenesis protein CcdA [Ruania rhizosphaerae]
MIDSSAAALALGAGLVAAVNPCGFALLPAYLSLFVIKDAPPTRRGAVLRALRASLALTIGFSAVFVTFGLVVAPVAAGVQAYLPVFTAGLGLALLGVGVWVALGRSLPSIRLPRRKGPVKPVTATWRSMIGFGASYAVASIGCTIAPFLAVVVTAFRADSAVSGIVLFTLYALGMGLTVAVAATATALARRGIIGAMRRTGGGLPRIAGGVLALAGAYVAWYGIWELRVLHAGAGPDPIVEAAALVQRWLAEAAGALGVAGLGVALAVLLVLALIRRRRNAPARD